VQHFNLYETRESCFTLQPIEKDADKEIGTAELSLFIREMFMQKYRENAKLKLVQ
jgi:hypothetical protein